MCVCVCVCVPDDPPEKQSQLGSILQSQSVGAPEITDISPLVDTCEAFKNVTHNHKTLWKIIGQVKILFNSSPLISTTNVIMMASYKHLSWKYKVMTLKRNKRKMTTVYLPVCPLTPFLILEENKSHESSVPSPDGALCKLN